MVHECLIVHCNSGNSYKSYERKAMLKYRPLSRARNIDSLFISFNITCGIRHCTLNNVISGSRVGSPSKQLSKDTVVSRDEFTILYMYSVARPNRVSLREPASCEYP